MRKETIAPEMVLLELVVIELVDKELEEDVEEDVVVRDCDVVEVVVVASQGPEHLTSESGLHSGTFRTNDTQILRFHSALGEEQALQGNLS